MQGGAGISIQSLLSTAINIAILYAIYLYVIKPNFDKIREAIPFLPDLQSLGLETYEPAPSSVDVFHEE